MIKKTFSAEKLLDKYGVAYKTRSAGKELVTDCLWHDDYKKKLYINIEKGIFNCFSCGEKGSFFKLAKKLSSTKKGKLVNLEDCQVDIFENLPSQPSGGEKEIKFPPFYSPLYEGKQESNPAYRYLIDKRKLTEQQLYIYKIGYCSYGPYGARIIVPIFEDGVLVSFIARDFTGILTPKVLTPPAIKGTSGVKDYIFNLDIARKTGHLCIAEGVFDALSIGPRGIAIFGKQLTTKQLAKIALTNPKKITVCLDPDARKEAIKLCNSLTTLCEDVTLLLLPEGEDPNSIAKSDLNLALDSAVPLNNTSFLKLIF